MMGYNNLVNLFAAAFFNDGRGCERTCGSGEEVETKPAVCTYRRHVDIVEDLSFYCSVNVVVTCSYFEVLQYWQLCNNRR